MPIVVKSITTPTSKADAASKTAVVSILPKILKFSATQKVLKRRIP